MTSLLQHRVAVIFSVAATLSILALVALWLHQTDALPLVSLSLALNFWAVLHSDRRGFFRCRELRRAYEPPRRFSDVQSLALILFGLLQFSLSVYVLVG